MAKLLHHRRSGLGLGFVFSPLPHYPTPQGNAHLPSQVIDKVSTINLEARSRCPIWIPIWPLITIRLDHRFAPVTRLPPRCCSGKLRALLSARLRSKSINLRIPLEGVLEALAPFRSLGSSTGIACDGMRGQRPGRCCHPHSFARSRVYRVATWWLRCSLSKQIQRLAFPWIAPI